MCIECKNLSSGNNDKEEDLLTPGITLGVQLVNRNIDTIKIEYTLCINDGSDFFKKLEATKSIAKHNFRVSPTVIYFEDFNIHPTAPFTYSFQLSKHDSHVIFSRPDKSGKFRARVEIGSCSCMNPGFIDVVNFYNKWFSTFSTIIDEAISEVHICADFVGNFSQTIPTEPGRYIKKAKQFAPHYINDHFTGVVIGKGNIMCRIYNKSKQLKGSRSTQKSHLLEDRWGITLSELDQANMDVVRLEFQLRRKVLGMGRGAFKVNTVDDLVNKLDGIWQYLVCDWLRITDSPVDRANNNQGKAKTSLFWQSVRAVVFCQGDSPLKRCKHNNAPPDPDKLLGIIAGCMTSLGAAYDCDNPTEAQWLLFEFLDKLLTVNPDKYHDVLKRKKIDIGSFASTNNVNHNNCHNVAIN